jgi:hypothetical protein
MRDAAGKSVPADREHNAVASADLRGELMSVLEGTTEVNGDLGASTS